MTNEMKLVYLPHELINRDLKGGMFFTRTNFLPFVSRVLQDTKEFVNDKNFATQGKKMLAIAAEEMKKNIVIYEEIFNKAITEESIVLEESIQHKFFEIWFWKLVHATTEEFVSSNINLKIKKGGQNLRDKLYSSKSKRKQKSEEKTKNSKKVNQTKPAKKGQNEDSKISKSKGKTTSQSKKKKPNNTKEKKLKSNLTSTFEHEASTSHGQEKQSPITSALSALRRSKRIEKSVKRKLVNDY